VFLKGFCRPVNQIQKWVSRETRRINNPLFWLGFYAELTTVPDWDYNSVSLYRFSCPKGCSVAGDRYLAAE